MMNHPLMTDAVNRARAFALRAHGEQRYGDEPYAVHLDAVAGLLEPYGAEAQVVGYLHDVAEDTSVGLEEIAAAFGLRVADCMALVTDSPGATRAERKGKTNEKLTKVKGELELALIVKAADRLANLRVSARGGAGSKLGMYRREHAAFWAAAYRKELCEPLWAEIERIIAG
jgi:guanosine-3',5'-bis(diphosphate) 3'-pyrophosphohydrolase